MFTLIVSATLKTERGWRVSSLAATVIAWYTDESSAGEKRRAN